MPNAPYLFAIQRNLFAEFGNMKSERGYHLTYGAISQGFYDFESEPSPSTPRVQTLRQSPSENEKPVEFSATTTRHEEVYGFSVHLRGGRDDLIDIISLAEADLNRAALLDRSRGDLSGRVNTFVDDFSIDYHSADGKETDGATVTLWVRLRYEHLSGDMSAG